MSRRALFTACAATLFFVASPVRADNGSKDKWALTLTAFGGYGRTIVPSMKRAQELDWWNGGGMFAGGLMFRSSYFLSPFVDIGYYPLYRSQIRVDLGSFGGQTVATNELDTVGFMGGAALDVWRLRLKAAIGLYDLHVGSTVLGRRVDPHQRNMGYLFAVSGLVLRRPRFEVGVELRSGVIVEADTSFFAFGFTMSGDAISF